MEPTANTNPGPDPSAPTAQPVQAPPPPTRPAGMQSDSVQKLIPTKNKPALFSYYCGIFGLIPFLGLVLSVVAVVLGIMGLSQFKQNPTPGAKGHAIAGIVLGALELTVFVIFILVTANR